MELIDNINNTLKSDWTMELRSGSKVAIAALCFFEKIKLKIKYEKI